jgi:nicotinate-nucleotide adenylyltransferase
MTARIGILGGMFDPVHNGHMHGTRTALKFLELDQLRIVPCHVPNHRNLTSCSAEQRVAMLELASAKDEGVIVDEIEIRRPGISYAVDTLKQLTLKNPGDVFVFVLGVDSFNSLPQWHQWQTLFELCHFAILNRSGSKVSESTKSATRFSSRKVETKNELFAEPSGKVIVIEDFDYKISSSLIREMLAANEPMAGELDEAVIQYIKSNNLYNTEQYAH